jgi:hypothetical protein
MNKWNNQKESAMVLLRGSARARFDITDFCTDVIEYLQTSDVAVLWVLKGLDSTLCANISIIDILKSLILQAFRIRSAKFMSGVDAIVAQHLPKFLNARTKEDWLGLLSLTLRSFSMVHIVVDTKAIFPIEAGVGTDANNTGLLIDTLTQLLENGAMVQGPDSIRSVVKVIVAHYGPNVVTPGSCKAPNEVSQRFMVHVQRNNSRRYRSASGIANNQARAKFTSLMPQPNGLPTPETARRLPRRPKKKKRLWLSSSAW